MKDKKKHLFVTGTDTGVGKTMITGFIARHYSDEGYKVVTQKCVETGTGSFSDDIEGHSRSAGWEDNSRGENMKDRAPYMFKDPVAPHLAARNQNIRIAIPRIQSSFGRLESKYEIVIVEGAGGVMVPINKNELMLDVMKALGLPVVIVASNRVGSINHAILTIGKLKSEGLKVAGIVYNQVEPGVRKDVIRDNPLTVKAFTGTRILANIPYSKDIDKLYGVFREQINGWIL